MERELIVLFDYTEGMQKKVALFDFDGTIARTVEEGVAVFNALARRHGFREITSENAEFLREHGPREAMKLLRVPLFKVPIVAAGLRKGVKGKIGEVNMPEGLRQTILDLKRKGYALGIVTVNSRDAVMAFLKKNEIEVFDYVSAGIGIFAKARAIGKMIKEHRFEKAELVFVGDEIRDVEAAHRNKLKVVAVTWGLNSRKGLEKARPDFLVDAPHELLGILA